MAVEPGDPSGGTTGGVLRRQAERQPDAPFILTGEASHSYGAVDALADRWAAGLHRLGVERGDTVALLAESSPELIALSFGANRLGAVWVPTNTDYRGEWLERTLADSRSRVLAVEPGLLPEVIGMLDDLPFEHVVLLGDERRPAEHAVNEARPGRRGVTVAAGDLLEGAKAPPEAAVATGETAAVLWTSGTTGKAKGVMQSHTAWLRAALTGAASSDTGPDDVLYCCLPLYNSAGWIGVVYRALVAGVPFGLDQRFSVGGFWERTRHYGATQAFTLGSMHIFLWQQPPQADDADNPVRCLGAIPMPDSILQPFKERFGIEIIQQGYGQSEIMGLISRVDDGSTRWNPGAVGVPLPGIEVRLLDDDDHEVPVGEPGEFCVRPTEPHVLFNGYFHDPEATLRACRNLWYHTGDLGRIDEDGQFHFVDRKADYIRFKGRSVSSFAVEAAVRSHPQVAEVAAFGIPSSSLASEAEIMVAVVPLQRGDPPAAPELVRHVGECAPYFMVPRFVEVIDELPLTPTGKVRKHLLRDRGVTEHTWDREVAGFSVRR